MYSGQKYRFLPAIALVCITLSQQPVSNGIPSINHLKPNRLIKDRLSSQISDTTNSEGTENPGRSHQIPDLSEPPLNWTEHWHRHDQQLHRVFLNGPAHVAVYFDRDGDSVASWVYNFVSQAWSYMVQTYGAFGPDPYLSLIVHKSRYPGCHMGYSLDPRNIHDQRNVLDCGSSSSDEWLKESHRNDTRDMIINYLASFVEVSSKQRWGSPSPADYVWREYTTWKTAWVDIFTYDVYRGLNMPSHAKRYLIAHEKKGVKNPREFTFWLRDWFLPIYNHNYGGPRVLNEYFELLAANFTQYLYKDRITYSGKLNMGQFIHFWSGAARRDLKVLAQGAFGWNATYQQQLDEARIEYPAIYELYNGTDFAETTMITLSTTEPPQTTEPAKFDSYNDTATNTTDEPDSTLMDSDVQNTDDVDPTDENTTAEHGADQTALPSGPAEEQTPPSSDIVQIPIDYFVIAIAVTVPVIILVVVIAFAYVILYKRRIEAIKRENMELAEEEVVEFFEGDPKANPEDLYSLVQSMPFVTDFEIPRDQIILAPDMGIIGSGQFGNIFHGLVRLNDSDQAVAVAIKMVKPNVEIAYFKTFLYEAKIMAYLGRHQNIVKLIGTCTTNIKNRELFIALEFCSLGNLRDYLVKHRDNFQSGDTPKCPKGGALVSPLTTELQSLTEDSTANDAVILNNSQGIIITMPDLLKWSQDIANGMMYIAEKKVIHGDLAARNILLNGNRTAKISDFGLSRQFLNYENYMKTSKTPVPWRWLAIEAMKDMQFSVASDVWAFGVTLWEIFTLGDTPYGAWTYDLFFVDRLIAGDRLQKPSNASPQIQRLLRDCWQKDPKSRPSFGAIHKSLGEFLAKPMNFSLSHVGRAKLGIHGKPVPAARSPVESHK